MKNTTTALVGLLLLVVSVLIGFVLFRAPILSSATGSAPTPAIARLTARPTVTPVPGYTIPGAYPLPTRGARPPVEIYARGTGAIQPRSAGTDPSVPNFTAQDVIDYVSTHPMRFQIVTDPARLVETVQFLKVEQANQIVNDKIPLAPGTLVCLVKLHGTFSRGDPFSGTRFAGTPVTSPNGYEVFDAHTGNLISYGIAAP